MAVRKYVVGDVLVHHLFHFDIRTRNIVKITSIIDNADYQYAVIILSGNLKGHNYYVKESHFSQATELERLLYA